MSAEEQGADATEDDDEEDTNKDEKKEGDAWGQWMRKGLMLQAEIEDEEDEDETVLVDEEECNAACKVAKLKAQMKKIQDT